MVSLRRRCLMGAALALPTAHRALAQAIDLVDARPDFRSDDLFPPAVEGTEPALAEERATAIALSGKIGSGVSAPLDIFRRFEALSRPAVDGTLIRNRDGEFYNEGWRTRWNPVIVRFFEETRTKPSGDTTFWCAASLNWALAHSGYRTTRSASSGSFRNADPPVDPAIFDMVESALTEDPKPGDIVVFRSVDPTSARAGQGHVALFLQQSSTQIQVIGGNQRTEAGHHGFSISWFPKGGRSLLFDSYRSIGSFG